MACVACVACVAFGWNRTKRKCLRWKAANYGCHCFDRASIGCNATHATQAIAFGWKPGFRLLRRLVAEIPGRQSDAQVGHDDDDDDDDDDDSLIIMDDVENSCIYHT